MQGSYRIEQPSRKLMALVPPLLIGHRPKRDVRFVLSIRMNLTQDGMRDVLPDTSVAPAHMDHDWLIFRAHLTRGDTR